MTRKLVSQSDIDELYGRDEDFFEKMKSRAETQVPPEVDETVSTLLGEADIEIADTDLVMKPGISVLIQMSIVEGRIVKQRILDTEVKKWLVRVSTASLGVNTPSPSIYQSSCHEYGEKFDEKRYICPNCWTQIIGR